MAHGIRCSLAFAIVLCASIAVGQGSGEGLGVSPPTLDLDDAQAGETYLRTVQVQNPTDTPSGIGIQRSGDVAAWTTSDPPSNFTIPAHGVRDVALTIAVPGNAGLGRHSGQLTFIADPKAAPSGSGSTFRPAVGLLLNATIGGQPDERLTWLSARVEDAVQGDPVHAFVLARNDGNVRTTAEASGRVLPFTGGDTVLSEASGSRLLLPGEESEVPLTFAAGLAVGQYRANLVGGGVDETLPFKVTALGAVAPDGELRAIFAPARSPAGRPLRMDAWFQNTGDTAIASATFHGEVRRGDELLATLESESLVVPPGGSVNLTVYWTPPSAGTFLASGHVTYDGYQTLPKETPLNVTPAAGVAASWWWLLLVLVVVLALVAIVLAWRKGRRDRRKAGR
ncbi:MAG: hypothetical protein QOC71_663 [Thermoplasmata archaeon]|nr:hypothetical protein [Thermoplasmata archaeon]